MTLEQLMAFTVTDDHARQEQVWEALQQSYNKEPYLIRRMLTEGAVRASDRRARFVGVDAYEAAGGMVLRDLFEDDDGGWLQDVGAARPAGRREAGGRGREDRRRRLEVDRGRGRFPLRPRPSSAASSTARRSSSRAEEQATLDALTAEYAKLESEYEGRRRAAGRGRCAARRDRDGARGLRESAGALRSGRDRARRRLRQHRCRRTARRRSRLCPAGGRAGCRRGGEVRQRRDRRRDETAPAAPAVSAPSSPSAATEPEDDGRGRWRSSRCRNGSSAS